MLDFLLIFMHFLFPGVRFSCRISEIPCTITGLNTGDHAWIERIEYPMILRSGCFLESSLFFFVFFLVSHSEERIPAYQMYEERTDDRQEEAEAADQEC